MSTYYYLCCEECRRKLHISQNRGDFIYGGKVAALGKFLKDHEFHDLAYLSEHYCKEPEQGYKEAE